MNKITIPASTANLGPGFDILGAGISLYLTLHFKLAPQTTIKYIGLDCPEIPLDPKKNYITKVLTYIANAYNLKLPTFELVIENYIPLGRGLGSSGSAVVGGVMLANELLHLNLSINKILDFSVFIEGHPDNVAGSIYGCMVSSMVRCRIPKFDEHWFVAGSRVPSPESILAENKLSGDLTYCNLIDVSQSISFVFCIPTFTLSTAVARDVLPYEYDRADTIFNMSRLTNLIFALQDKGKVDATMIYESMKDKLHQSYRAHLVPGLSEILGMCPTENKGLLGVCLSGAGPSVLALCDNNCEEIGARMVELFKARNVDARSFILSTGIIGASIELHDAQKINI